MDLGVPVEIDVKGLREEYEKALKENEKYFKYKEIKFYTNYAKYLLEYVEGKGKDSFRISERDLPEE